MCGRIAVLSLGRYSDDVPQIPIWSSTDQDVAVIAMRGNPALPGRLADITIIILTGRGETVDRIIGLEMGADDYLPKPFHLRELLAR